MIKVLEVKAREDYTLDLKFSDGKRKRFNAMPYLDFEVFKELKAPAKFKQVRVVFGTVQWPNEQDISPETLYIEGTEINESEFYDESDKRLNTNLEA